jgi:peptide/nickel transport system substrate-binding protein
MAGLRTKSIILGCVSAFLTAVFALTFAAAQAQTPQKGGILRISSAGSPRLIDPPLTGSVEEWMVTSWLYSNLTKVDSKFTPQPDLAESWKSEENGKVWTFVLRKGVKFHSGKELTAEDVEASIARILDPNTKSRGRGGIGPIEKIEVIDKSTIKFTLARPISDFPSNLALPYARITPKGTTINLNTQADGTGPFILKEFIVGEKVVLERNPNYFRSGLPYVDGLQLNVIPDSTAEINALKDSRNDIMYQVRPDQVALLDGVSGIKVEEVPTGTYVPIVMRVDQPPFNDVRVRKALKLSIDRKAAVQNILGGHGTIGNDQSLPPNNPFYNPSVKAPERDIAKAKQLLKDAGYPDGVKLTMYTSDARVGMLPLALITKDMAKDAGFDISIQNVPWDVYLNTVWEKRQFYTQNWFARPTTDTSILPYFVTRDKGGSLNEYWYSNPELDKLLLGAQGELDQEKRKQMYYKAQEILAEDGPAVITFFRNNITAYRTNVVGYHADPGISFPAEEVWLQKK